MAVTHLIIGAGKMGGALMTGWLDAESVRYRNIAILDPNPGTQAVYAIEKGAKHLNTLKDIPSSVRTVLLAIKPQMFDAVGPDLGQYLPKKAVVVSILAGTSLASLRGHLAPRTVIRAMPNTPSAIGAGISAIFTDPTLDEADILRAETLLLPGGEVVRVDSEAALNAVTAVSGSGPAYVFYMVEALEAAARDVGLPDEVAAKLARATISGAAKLLDADDTTPGELRRNVTSPNGTTQAALDELMSETGLTPLMMRTVRAAFKRAKELSAN